MAIITHLLRAARVPARAAARFPDGLGGGVLGQRALRTAAASVGILALIALAGAQVRVLPWLIDPRVPWRVAVPFARAVASVALEAAVLVGWPVGWALAAFVAIERGEARVLALLGERPAGATRKLVPGALVLGAILAATSIAGGRDASEPGNVLADLLRAGRASCAAGDARPSSPRAADVPLLGASWLCGPEPTLVGHPPFSQPNAQGAAALYSARAVEVAPDARRISLHDAVIAGGAGTIRVKDVVLRLPPFVRATSLSAPWRAAFLAVAGAGSALLAVWLLLVMDQRALVLWRLHALLIGSAGPVATLAMLHALEAHESGGAPPLLPLLGGGAAHLSPLVYYGVLPGAAALATLCAAALVTRLPGVRVAAS